MWRPHRIDETFYQLQRMSLPFPVLLDCLHLIVPSFHHGSLVVTVYFLYHLSFASLPISSFSDLMFVLFNTRVKYLQMSKPEKNNIKFTISESIPLTSQPFIHFFFFPLAKPHFLCNFISYFLIIWDPSSVIPQYVCVQVAQLRQTLWDSMDCSLQSSSVQEISQARILEWVAVSYSRGSFWPRDLAHVSCICRQILYHWATWEAVMPRCFMLICSWTIGVHSYLQTRKMAVVQLTQT